MKNGNYIVIYPTQIEPSLPSPSFGRGWKRKEAEYLTHMTEAQPFINTYANTGELTLASTMDAGIHKAFFDPASRIIVKRADTGTFIPYGNGYHRIYVARKYGLKLIAYLDE